MFDLKKDSNNQYASGTTFCFWAGYWECAVKHGILVGDEADINKKDKPAGG